ncbi:hypothetical protein GIB67_038754 [Kingdonia uniflora]|uniref:Peptidase M3A/M3B catalytic domain-containing protein n=1 Tax=Kingdonia uniflora TaxID=39325 RepID=A0A7J7NSR3_9MAGN|nr:hypothetical protein GIB67_038754 [Kingdonia uniflora]
MPLHDPEGGDLGYLYLDLCLRKGKHPSCGHFTIKGGRRLSEIRYQLPIVALVCNFSAPFDSSTTRLKHWEVENLLHEFGYYAWDYRFLRTFAKYYLIGEVIPEEVVESMKGVRNPWQRGYGCCRSFCPLRALLCLQRQKEEGNILYIIVQIEDH